MSSNNKLIFVIFCLITFSFSGIAKSTNSNLGKEDLYILMALDSERLIDKSVSLQYFVKLYNLTNNEIYLKKSIIYSYKAKLPKKMENLSRKGLELYKKENKYYSQELIISLLSQQKINQALSIGKKLLSRYKDANTYEIMANIYYAKGDYKNSLKFYESAYAINQNVKTLVQLTTIMYVYLDKKDMALAYLETYLQDNGCNKLVCDKLMLIYQEQGNIDGMVSILNRMYAIYSKNPSLKKTTLIIQNLIVALYEKQNINKAIKYLETYHIDQSKLINLYYQNHQLKKALNLTRKLYRKYKRPVLLGKIAMYEFELAKDKQKVMKHVIANFELALSSGINNAGYQNYYGYLLIDFNIDVKKGIKLVKMALITSPKNISYLDSLAWGYYKIGRCIEAKNLIKKVVSVTGLNNKDIKRHYDKIINCNKDKIK